MWSGFLVATDRRLFHNAGPFYCYLQLYNEWETLYPFPNTDNLGVYTQNSKGGMGVFLFNPLTGKQEATDLKKLANQ